MLSRLSRLSRFGPVPRLLSSQQLRFVSQSKPAGTAAVTELHLPDKDGHGEVSPFLKNPDYHGFSSDPVEDAWNMKVGFFLGVSVAVVIGGTFIHYLPDHGKRQWARREAERLVTQREKDGLPLMTENYYDTEKIVLPSSGL